MTIKKEIYKYANFFLFLVLINCIYAEALAGTTASGIQPSGSITSGHCAQWSDKYTLVDAGDTCSTISIGDTITSGSSGALLYVGTSSTLAQTSTPSIDNLIVLGNVGIGSTVPAYTLDVAGTLHAAGAVSLGSTLLVTGTATLSTAPVVSTFTTAGVLTNAVTGLISSTTTVTPSGDISVGTTGVFTVSGIQGTAVTTPIGTGGPLLQYNPIALGSVGIGTASPATTLDINGSVTLELGTTGAVLCLTSSHVVGHCASSASCTGTCTCTCVAN